MCTDPVTIVRHWQNNCVNFQLKCHGGITDEAQWYDHNGDEQSVKDDLRGTGDFCPADQWSGNLVLIKQSKRKVYIKRLNTFSVYLETVKSY